MTIIAIVSAAIGLLLVSWSAFLYEPEERNIADALDRWWVAIDDVRSSAIRTNASLVRRVAEAVIVWLNDLFGDKMFSLRVIGASVCLSVASSFLLSSAYFVYIYLSGQPILYPIRPVGFLAGGILMFAAATAAKRHFEIERLLAGLAGVLAYVVFVARTSGHVPGLVLGLIVGIASDLVVLSITRRLALWAANAAAVIKPLLVATINALVGATLVVAPVVLMNTGRMGGIVADILGYGVLTNAFVGLIAFSFILLPLTLAVQRVLWPIVERPLYAIARFRVLQNRRVLFFAGTTLLAVAVPQMGALRQATVDILLR